MEANSTLKPTRESRAAWVKVQKQSTRIRRLLREKEGLLDAIQLFKDSLKHMPMDAKERLANQERIEVLKFDLQGVEKDIAYWKSA